MRGARDSGRAFFAPVTLVFSAHMTIMPVGKGRDARTDKNKNTKKGTQMREWYLGAVSAGCNVVPPAQ